MTRHIVSILLLFIALCVGILSRLPMKIVIPIILIAIVYIINRTGYTKHAQATKKQKILIILYLSCFMLFWGSIIYGKIVDPLFKIVSHGVMSPTIQAGDRIITDKVKDIKRGMLVVYMLNRDQIQILEKNNFKYLEFQVGRVIGMPGEEISVSNGIVSINSNRLIEKYASALENFTFQSISIPVNNYFIMKDRRKLIEGDSICIGTIESNQIKHEIIEIHRPTDLKFDTGFKLLIGTLILLSYFTVPVFFYKRIPNYPLIRIIFQIHIMISSTILILIVGDFFKEVRDTYRPEYFWMLPFDYYYNTFSWLRFLTISSPIAFFLTTLMGWIGGIVTVTELSSKFKRM